MVQNDLEPLSVLLYTAGATPAKLREEIATTLQYARQDLNHGGVVDDSTFKLATDELVKGGRQSAGLEQQTIDRRGQQLKIYADRLDSQDYRADASPDDVRPALSECLEDVVALETEPLHLVVENAARLLDDNGGLSWIRGLVGTHDVHVHFADDRVTIRAGADVNGSLMRAVMLLADRADAVADVSETLTHQGGRPPVGFTSEGGELVPDDDYQVVCAALQDVRLGRLSKKQAASEIGCTRQTVTAALDRPSMYGLE